MSLLPARHLFGHDCIVADFVSVITRFFKVCLCANCSRSECRREEEDIPMKFFAYMWKDHVIA